jgi:hypothetical protein
MDKLFNNERLTPFFQCSTVAYRETESNVIYYYNIALRPFF